MSITRISATFLMTSRMPQPYLRYDEIEDGVSEKMAGSGKFVWTLRNPKDQTQCLSFTNILKKARE
jgi:hypothetical protein